MNSDRHPMYYSWLCISVLLYFAISMTPDMKYGMILANKLLIGWIVSTYKMARLNCKDLIEECVKSKDKSTTFTEIIARLRENLFTRIVFAVIIATIVELIHVDNTAKFAFKSVSLTMLLESLMNIFVMHLGTRD